MISQPPRPSAFPFAPSRRVGVSASSTFVRMPIHSTCSQCRLIPDVAGLSQHHAAMHDALDASGFVLWRTFPRRRSCTLHFKQLGMPANSLPLQRVILRQNKLQPRCSACVPMCRVMLRGGSCW